MLRAMTSGDAENKRPAIARKGAGQEPINRRTSNPSAMKTTTLLLADADAFARQTLAGFLQNRGFTTLQADRESTAIELFESNDIGLLVLDMNLGKRSGWDAVARLVRVKPLVPAIVMTDDGGQEARAAELGADVLLEKPIEYGELLRIIQELLAHPTEVRLHRVCTVEAFARYVPRSYEIFLHTLQERYTVPLATPALDDVLARCVPPLTGKIAITPKSTHAGGFTGVSPV